jgi:hypothetical protein
LGCNTQPEPVRPDDALVHAERVPCVRRRYLCT